MLSAGCNESYVPLILPPAPTPQSENAKPDLLPTKLDFDSQGKLMVSFMNKGNKKIPPNKGSISIFIDGMMVGGYAFANLSDQSFLNPGKAITIPTNFKLSGKNRRIGMHLDPYNEIDELNEFQNTYSKTLTPPVTIGPDFSIQSVDIKSSTTRLILNGVRILNGGNSASSSNLTVDIRVIIDDVVKGDYSPILSAIPGNGEVAKYSFPSPIPVPNGSKRYRILLNTKNYNDEIDNTNGILEGPLPSGPTTNLNHELLAPYRTLLANRKIKKAIVWKSDHYRTVSYSQWTQQEKKDLDGAILDKLGLSPSVMHGAVPDGVSFAWK